METPRSSSLVCVAVLLVAGSARAQPQRAPLFNDAHVHLTNYIQEGTDIRDFLRVMGDKVGRDDALWNPAPATVDVFEHGRFRALVLPANGRPALLLLVHRRADRHGLSLAAAGATGALRSDDHRVQSDGHVRRRSHSARAHDLSRRVRRNRRIFDSQGVRVVQDCRRDGDPEQPRARSHLRFRRRSWNAGDLPLRRQHAVSQAGTRSISGRSAQRAGLAPSEHDDHLGARRGRANRPSGRRSSRHARARHHPEAGRQSLLRSVVG